jgi:hypothetical protein
MVEMMSVDIDALGAYISSAYTAYPVIVDPYISRVTREDIVAVLAIVSTLPIMDDPKSVEKDPVEPMMVEALTVEPLMVEKLTVLRASELVQFCLPWSPPIV